MAQAIDTYMATHNSDGTPARPGGYSYRNERRISQTEGWRAPAGEK